MAIIDPDGLFGGERLANCSDLAQLYWPRFFLAANSCARLELSYKPLVSRVFGNFQKVPESSEIWKIFQEYSDNFLAVLYESPEGGWWCQFITSEKYLPKYKKTKDDRGPAPSFEQMEASRKGYLAYKKAKSISANSFENFQKISDRRGIGVGIGIGVGGGVGEAKATSVPPLPAAPVPENPVSTEERRKADALKPFPAIAPPFDFSGTPAEPAAGPNGAERVNPMGPDAGVEMELATWFFQELGIPADFTTREAVCQAIRGLVKIRGFTAKEAADYLLEEARKSSEPINRFWFLDQKYMKKRKAQPLDRLKYGG